MFLRDPSPQRRLLLTLVLSSLGSLALVFGVDRLPLGAPPAKALLCLVLLLAALTTLSRALSRGLEEPLRRLAREARSGEVPRLRRGDGAELGRLAQAFGELASERTRLASELARLEGELAARTAEFSERSEKLQSDMAQASAAAQIKAQLLANMSHEIRTPMNGILGMNEFLLESELAPQQKAWAETIRSSAESLLGIIDDILDFSKIEAGKMRLEALEFDLHRTVREVVSLLQGVAVHKGIGLVAEIAPDVPRAVIGDPMRLRQVLTNLLGNALKFTLQGQVRVRVTRAPGEAGAVALRFEVQDTGIGIAQAERERLFLPFSQADVSTTRRFGGTGLGLSISRTLVELMGGQIGVESELGVGSTFWFTVCFEPGRSAYRSFLVPEGKTRPRVLVAEGSAAAREQLHQLLGAWGFEHELVADAVRARSALQRQGSEPFGLCLVDQNLLEDPLLARTLRGASLAIVRLVWAGSPSTAIAFEDAPAIGRPIRPSALYDVLTDVVGTDEVNEVELARMTRDPRDVPTRGSLRVLLAEDNLVNQAVAARVLAREGYDCEMVTDGRQALEAVRSGNYDVVFMDCQMPELDGFEATREIRRWEGRTGVERPVRIVALTANALTGDREKCLAAGMDHYLSKPIKPQLLRELLQRLETDRSRAPGASNRADAEDPSPALAGAQRRPLVGPPEELRALVRDFDQRSVTALGRLRRGLAQHSAEDLRAGSRELQELPETLASERLVALARQLERLAESRTLDRAFETLTQLEAEFARCRAALPQVLAGVRDSSSTAGPRE